MIRLVYTGRDKLHLWLWRPLAGGPEPEQIRTIAPLLTAEQSQHIVLYRLTLYSVTPWIW